MRSWKVKPLYSPLAPFFFRRVLHARIDHPVGLLDVFTTHLASDSDLATLPCGFQVPPPFPRARPPLVPPTCMACNDTGRACSVRECQAKQAAAFVEAQHKGPKPALLSGDLNAEPAAQSDPLESTYREFTGRGWLDSHLAAGNAECDPASGTNCTSGRVAVLGELEKLALNVDERIDYIFVSCPPLPS